MTTAISTINDARRARSLLVAFHRPYRRVWFWVVCCFAVMATTNGLLGLELKKVIDGSMQLYQARDVADRALARGLNWQVALFLALLAVRSAARMGGSYGLAWITQSVARDLRAAMFERVTQCELVFFESTTPAEINNRLLIDLNKLQQESLNMLNLLLGSAPLLVVGGSMMFVVNWSWALAVTLGTVVIGLLVALGLRRVEHAATEAQARLGIVSAYSTEVIRNIRVAKLDDQIDRHQRTFASILQQSAAALVRVQGLRSAINATASFCGAVVLLAIVWWAVARPTAGHSPGQLVSFWFYGGLAITALVDLLDVAAAYREGLGSSQRALELLELPVTPRSQRRPSSTRLRPIRGALSVRHVSYSYARPDEAVAVRDVCFELPPGTKAGLVGRSGAGKSTLLDLIVGLRTPQTGTISLDGADITTLDPELLRSSVALVHQDLLLFGTSVLENIRYARPTATIAEVRAAAEAACASSFIERLPHGYDTLLGESVCLSGGEKQRIAIARALLKDPRLLILDEATSALDTHTELRVRQALYTLMRGRTVLFATHRLANVTAMDLVLFMDAGRLAAVGPHAALLRTNERYAELAHTQFSGDTIASTDSSQVTELAR